MVEFFDVEYEIEKRLIKGLRAIFEKDKVFRYNKNNKESKILITTSFPEDGDNPTLLPHLVVTNTTYSNNIQTTFGYNFMRERQHKGINAGVRDYAFIIPYSVTISCLGGKSTSKDLASKVNWYLSFAASHFANEFLGLQLTNIQKGGTAPTKQFPKKLYDTQISISGTLYWVGSKGPDENSLSDIDTPLKNVKIKF